MNKLVLAAAVVTAFSPALLHAGDPQGPESLDTGNLGEYYDPTTTGWLTSPPPPADIPSEDTAEAAVFADVTVGSNTYGDEWLIPYDPNGSVTQFSMIDDTPDSFTISNAGFLTSDTQIPLDSLGDTSLPSGFTPLPGLDGDQLSNGGVSPTVSLPEPGSFWLAGLAATVFFLLRRAHLGAR